ncbi:SDR family NAD(P)-dependent oxidoreductase [Streptomyces sp. KMM 9044]|uniref:SDR family NAD(P)-dependent oxidoreductase n=1 Tax=Streptomyces sp. KMM 9044 TaxID=2744474 RepID=UPI002151CCD8|nr:SDR family oxidoreductase [Streptomyces sp. KMM 9044]WAX81504.1 SDR family NAD(P)-dependent oxidoreductase [Streptomyces sp. KMM 9044]
MNLNGARVLVAGATGVLGQALTAELAGRGARPVLAGRDPARLARAAQAYPDAPTFLFDAYDPASCARVVHGAAAEPGGLDAVVTAFGSVAFGRAEEIGDEIAEYLMAVNVLAPAAFFRAALAVMKPGSAIAAVTGVVAERPQAGMADYSASKAALSAWLGAARREARTAGIRVLDIRPGHLDTGFADRSVAGTAPPMPEGGDPRQVVAAVADALEADAELLRTAADGALLVERRAR